MGWYAMSVHGLSLWASPCAFTTSFPSSYLRDHLLPPSCLAGTQLGPDGF